MSMTDKKLKKLLKENNVSIVHFSHHAETRPGVFFPSDLQNGINHRKCWELSCHAIWPGHRMKLVGSVGIIFEPLVENVLTVKNSDSGSSVYGSLGKSLTIENFHESFQVADEEYNEWRIINAKVKGIFVFDSNNILTRRPVSIKLLGEVTKTMSAEPVTLNEIKSTFPGCTVYTMGSTGLEIL